MAKMVTAPVRVVGKPVVAPPPPLPAPVAQPIQARIIAAPPPPPSSAAPPPSAAPVAATAPPAADKATGELMLRIKGLETSLAAALDKQKEMADTIKKMSVVPEFIPPSELLPPEGVPLPVRADDWRRYYHGNTASLHMWAIAEGEQAYTPAPNDKGSRVDVFFAIPRDNAPLASGVTRVKGERSPGAAQRAAGSILVACSPNEEGTAYGEFFYMKEDEVYSLIRPNEEIWAAPTPPPPVVVAPPPPPAPVDPNADLAAAGYQLSDDGAFAWKDGNGTHGGWYTVDEARATLAPTPAKRPGRPPLPRDSAGNIIRKPA